MGKIVDGLGRVFTVERIGPGLYTDDQGGLHIVVKEILEAYGYPDTEENRDMLVEETQEVVAELYPGTPVDLIDARGRHTL